VFNYYILLDLEISIQIFIYFTYIYIHVIDTFRMQPEHIFL